MSGSSAYRAVLIAGPTASGKSEVALKLAERLNGTIINADSMQVYRELKTLTARPTAEDKNRAPHRLYGHKTGHPPYSSGQWLQDVAYELKICRQTGRLPIITGGTGLYFKLLLEGLSPMPDIPEQVRQFWRNEMAAESSAELHRHLAAKDPVMAQLIRPSDRQRIVRALEIYETTGKSLAYWQAQPKQPVLAAAQCLRLFIDWERAELYARCDLRFDRMIETGALQEVQALRTKNYPSDLPIMRALGVRPLTAYLDGQCSLDAAVSQAKTETRRYAKRQLTWARGQMADWHWLKAHKGADLTQQIFNFLKA